MDALKRCDKGILDEYNKLIEERASKYYSLWLTQEKKALKKMPTSTKQKGRLSLEEIARLCSKVEDWSYVGKSETKYTNTKVDSYKGVVMIDNIFELNVQVFKWREDYIAQASTNNIVLGSYHSSKSKQILDMLKPLYNAVKSTYDANKDHSICVDEKMLKKKENLQRKETINFVREYLHK